MPNENSVPMAYPDCVPLQALAYYKRDHLHDEKMATGGIEGILELQ